MESKKINVKVVNHSKVDGHVGYFLEIETGPNMSFTISKRYSELKTLNDLLRKETNNNSFPKFPPKKFFGFASEEFINRRQQELNVYFGSICKSQEFSKLPSFVKFIDDCIKSKNDLKIMSERPTVVQTGQTNYPKSTKTTIDSFREKFRPDKVECKKLSEEEIKAQDEEFQKIVNDFKSQFIEIDFQVAQNISEQNEKKYDDLIKGDNVLKVSDEMNLNLQSGNDDNFNLISDSLENVDGVEKNIKFKMEEIINKENEINSIYDINEIMKTL